MVQLHAISTDKLGYESQSLTFKFNDVTMFRLSNHSLNRGGKGFTLLDSNSKEIASCGREHRSFYRKCCRVMKEMGFQIEESDIECAIEKRHKENVDNHDSVLIAEWRSYKNRLKDIEIEKMKLQNKMKTIKNSIINKEKLAQ